MPILKKSSTAGKAEGQRRKKGIAIYTNALSYKLIVPITVSSLDEDLRAFSAFFKRECFLPKKDDFSGAEEESFSSSVSSKFFLGAERFLGETRKPKRLPQIPPARLMNVTAFFFRKRMNPLFAGRERRTSFPL